MNPDDLKQDWATIWASEANALAVDREMAEAISRNLHWWAWQMTALYSALPYDPAGPATPALPPGTPAAAPAPCER